MTAKSGRGGTTQAAAPIGCACRLLPRAAIVSRARARSDDGRLRCNDGGGSTARSGAAARRGAGATPFSCSTGGEGSDTSFVAICLRAAARTRPNSMTATSTITLSSISPMSGECTCVTAIKRVSADTLTLPAAVAVGGPPVRSPPLPLYASIFRYVPDTESAARRHSAAGISRRAFSGEAHRNAGVRGVACVRASSCN